MVTPPIAIRQCRSVTLEMAALARESVVSAIGLLKDYDPLHAERISQIEEQLDRYEDALGTYLVKLSAQQLSQADTREVSKLLHTISDFERISDHAKSLSITAKSRSDRQVRFSPRGQAEFDVLSAAIHEVLSITQQAFCQDDLLLAGQVEPLEQVVDYLCDCLKLRHIQRLQEGACTVEQGLLFTDLLNDLRRVSDHCSNVAAAVIELKHDSYDTHSYLAQRRTCDNDFAQLYQSFMAQFPLPQ